MRFRVLALAACAAILLAGLPASHAEPAPPAKALDVSHWTGTITAAKIQALKASGYHHLVCGTQVRATTRQQLAAAVAGGMTVDAYVMLHWTGDTAAQVHTALSTIHGYPVQRLWLDVEQPPGGRSAAQLADKIRKAIDACGTFPNGIYSAAWWWLPNMHNSTAFAHKLLWYARYDHVASLGTWPSQKFGGWASPFGKQYADGPHLHGVNVDYNVMRVGGSAAAHPTSAPAHGSGGGAPAHPSHAVTMSWGALSGAHGYQVAVERKVGGTWVPVHTYATTATSLVFTPPIANTDYRWRVRGVNGAGPGAFSGWAVFHVGALAALPASSSTQAGLEQEPA
ncbi:MAG: hypothetical protein HYZ53_28940 [Planctomycetes bacterium]|nr:hypothetical protein [Planctomycetota bacterium]